MKMVLESPAALALGRIGKPLGSVSDLLSLRATSEVRCPKNRGEPCIATQQVQLNHLLVAVS